MRESSPGIFFIVGRERSGTTLLQVMLDLHPSIVVPTESPFITYLSKRYAGRRFFDDDSLEEFLDDLFTEPYIRLWNVDREKVKSSLLSAPARNFRELCKAVLLSSSSASGKNDIALVGDKNPVHSLRIPELVKIFPEARFIFISRDPRDQVASMMRVNFERKNLVSLSCRWNHYNDKMLNDLRGLNHIHVKYEDLIIDPEKKLSEICAFLGVGYIPVMLNTHEKANSLIENKMLLRQHHHSLTRSVDKAMAYKWKTNMPEADVELIDRYTSVVASKLGYESTVVPHGSSVMHLFPRAYGNGYFIYLKLLHALPFTWQRFIFNQLISKSFQFWKETASSAEEPEKR